jgi:hypothetical protein
VSLENNFHYLTGVIVGVLFNHKWENVTEGLQAGGKSLTLLAPCTEFPPGSRAEVARGHKAPEGSAVDSSVVSNCSLVAWVLVIPETLRKGINPFS